MKIQSIIHLPNSIHNRIVETSQNNPTCKLALDILKQLKPMAAPLTICAAIIYSSDIYHLFARNFLTKGISQNQLTSLTQEFRDLAKEAGLVNADNLQVYVTNIEMNLPVMSHFFSPTPRIYVDNRLLTDWIWYGSNLKDIYGPTIAAIARGDMLKFMIFLPLSVCLLQKGLSYFLTKMCPKNDPGTEGEVKQFDKRKFARLTLQVLGYSGIACINLLAYRLLILNKPTPVDMEIAFLKRPISWGSKILATSLIGLCFNSLSLFWKQASIISVRLDSAKYFDTGAPAA